ncbi:hypothetical protein [Paracoccus mutanolyticus]|nr:hypothetical protein [Paracoccus mutanolyticus]
MRSRLVAAAVPDADTARLERGGVSPAEAYLVRAGVPRLGRGGPMLRGRR